jgi:hypothetical protein
MKFKASLLNSAFESSVKSGKFLLLPRNDRNKLNVLYDMIEKSNYNGLKILDMQFVLPSSETRELFRKIRTTQFQKYTDQHKRIKEKLIEADKVLKETT